MITHYNFSRMKNQDIISQKQKKYIAPDFEVMEIEIEQNILVDSSGDPGLPKEVW